MAVRVADTLKQQNDLKTFPVAYSEDIWIDENKGEGDANFKDLQTLYNENKLGGSGLPEPESADKVLLSASSNTRADGLEWKQVSKNDVGLQLPEFESLEEWDSLPADEKSKYYNAGKGYVVIKEDVKGAKGVIDDTKPTSTVTTLSAKKISDSLVDNYSTNEIKTNKVWINGKSIYRKVIDLGYLPSALTRKNVPHNIDNLDTIVKFHGICTGAGQTLSLPFSYRGAPTEATDNVSINMYIETNGIITIYPMSDRSAYYGYVIIEYTKTTD